MEWYIFALLSAVFSSFLPIINKKVLKKVSLMDFSAVYSILTFLFSLSFLSLVKITFDLKVIFLIFLGSVFSTLGFYAINKAIKRSAVSLVSPLRSFNPVVLLIMSMFLLGDKINASNIVGIAFIVLGAYVIEARDMLHKPLEPLKRMLKSSLLFLIMSSAIFYAVSSIIDKVVLSFYDIFGFFVLIHLFIALNFFVINILETRRLPWNGHIKSSFSLIILASVVTIFSRIFLLQSISLGIVSLVIAIKHTDTLIATTIGGEIFHEKHLKKKIAAAFIMLVGVMFVILKP
ncbi:MAG TPA: EamA family transporter [archaeon]|nr:EamA family transporter [archaeon]